MQKEDINPVTEIGLLAETSWEVCNKVGGIYTVLSTKAKSLKSLYGDRLVFIGPDLSEDNGSLPNDFIERPTILGHARERIKLPKGVSIRTGRWRVPGSPLVILVRFKSVRDFLNDIYGEMWQRYGVESLYAYGDYDESCAFAIASAMVIEALASHLKVEPSRVVAHFNEWTTGMGLLYLKARMPQAATLFTTHATSIGRSICGNGKPLYDYFTGYNGDQMAGELNMVSKHSLEKAAAHQADCFTAVSEFTARECEQLLDIRPQVVTPNGFEPGFVPGSSKYVMLRREGRKKLFSIASALKGKDFDDDTMIVVISGRNEYRNKGLDLFLDSVRKAGGELSADKKILALALVPGWVSHPATGPGNPDFLTHRLHNEDSDALASRIRQIEREGIAGNVDIIDVPCYLDGSDGVVDISYYDILPAVDMTVFPSYYEPWGYTPLESIAFGIPTVTTDKSGFGQWILSTDKNGLTSSGVIVIDRTDSNYDEACDAIATAIAGYANSRVDFKEKSRKAAKSTSRLADWKFFIEQYQEAFAYALSNRDKRIEI